MPPARPAPSKPTVSTASGSVSQSILRAQTAEAKKGVVQRIPDGFPEAVTVLFIIARSDSGPAPKHMLELVRSLKETGFRILIASPVNPPFAFEYKKQADHFVNIPNRDFSLKALWRLRRAIRKNKVNLIHSHGRTGGVYSRLLGLMTGAAVVHTFHGVQVENSFDGIIKLWVDKFLSNLKFDPIFFSKTEQERALEKRIVRADREAAIIEESVNLSRFPKRKIANLAFAKVIASNPETFKKIRVGALLRQENRRSFESFLKLAKDCAPFAQFTCAGVTRLALAQKGTIPDSLEVVGPVADHIEWMYSLDVLVNTSPSEAPMIDSLEAMAAGTICVMSDIPSHAPFEQQHAALLFDPKSPETFRKAVAKVRDDLAFREMILGNSRYMVERLHDTDTFRMKLMDVYRQGVKRALGLVL